MAANSSGWIGPAVSVAGSLLSTGLGAVSAGKMNKRGENFARWMYQHQRRDALADWEMQNQYNSPQAQMQRFRDAGLNPNLMYGQGESGAASSVRSSSASQPKYTVPNFGAVGSIVQDALAAKQMRANIQRTNAETAQVQENTRGSRFKNALNDAIGLDALSRDESGRLVSITSPSSMMQRVLSAGYSQTFQKLENARKDGSIKDAIQVVKEYEANLARQGISPNSPWYLKVLTSLLEKFDVSLF